jgi:predicted signal transduction protein with EAL and GGDEF domain
VYQPVLEAMSGVMVGAEALIRRDRPGHGLLSPDSFIPIAEVTALIIDVDCWVLKEATRQLIAWSSVPVHALGVDVAIDDFGTGYISLAHLQQRPVDIINIDRSFVSRLNVGRGSSLLCIVTDLGHAIGITIVAEGVETSEEMSALQERAPTSSRVTCSAGRSKPLPCPRGRTDVWRPHVVRQPTAIWPTCSARFADRVGAGVEKFAVPTDLLPRSHSQ